MLPVCNCNWYDLSRYYQFRDISGEVRFSQFEIEDNKHTIIWMLHVHCLDMETGAILWNFRV